MNKNSIIGLVLIGAILFGFSWFQSKQYEKQREAVQAYNDSLAMEQRVLMALDSLHQNDSVAAPLPQEQQVVRYKDSLLDVAAENESTKLVLANDKIEVTLSTRGAQPYSVLVKDYKAYSGDELMLVRPDQSEYGISVYAGENINTRDFTFSLVEKTDSTAVMRLYFADGGYIQQKYILPEGSYMLYNELSFCSMEGIIPRKVSYFDIDWSLNIPRLEKGYKNEKQYSKMSVCCPDEKPDLIGKGNNGSKRYDSKVSWFGFNQQFFSAFMTAPKGFASGDFSISFYPENDPDHNLLCGKADLRHEFSLKDGDPTYSFEFYFGPNKYNILRDFDRNYDKVITVGGEFIGLITRYVIIPCFDWMSRGIQSYGLIILLMTLLIKLVISPLTIKSYLSSAKMNALKPEVDKLNDKFPKAKTDQSQAMKKQQATMDLYKRAGVNPAGGCLPLLLQFPILWAMFRFFPSSIELRQQPFLWAEDLSAYDSICDFGFSILGMDHLSLFALLMAVTMFFYSKITMPKSTDPTMAPMRFMSVYLMPVMMFFICNSLSSGLSYYYFLSQLITILQNIAIKKWMVKPEKLLAQIEANKNKPVQKSKWQLRLEEAQKMAQQQQKNRR